MNSTNKMMNGIAGFVAILATVVICGGTLSLADHYSHTGGSDQEYIALAHQAAPAALKRVS
jgi:hypothetical protein